MALAFVVGACGPAPRVPAQAPSPPTGIVAIDSGAGLARISWTDESANESCFEVERDPAFGTRRLLAPNSVELFDDPGNGVHRYRVRAMNAAGASDWTGWTESTIASGHTPVPNPDPNVSAEGWTELVPSADSRVIYVSATSGDDANDGLSEGAPKRTILAAYNELRHLMPDWILLKRGEAWDEGLPAWQKSGRSDAEPMVVSTYGTGAGRAVLRTGSGGGFTRTRGGGGPDDCNYLAVIGLKFKPHTRRPDEGAVGILFLGRGSDILFEDCDISGYSVNIDIEGGEFDYVDRFKLRRCIVADAHWPAFVPNGLYADKTRELLIEDCFFIANGWREGVQARSPLHHNIYLQTTCEDSVIRGTISADASSHGAQMRGGGVAHDNLFARNPIALLMGTGGAQTGGTDPDRPLVMDCRRNVIVEGIDLAPEAPRGWGVTAQWISAGSIVDTIIANQYTGGTAQAIDLNSDAGRGNFSISIMGNVVYDWRGAVQMGGDQNALNGIIVRNNFFQEPTSRAASLFNHTHAPGAGQFSFGDNQYWTTLAPGLWFYVAGQNVSLDAYRDLLADGSSAAARAAFADPARSLATYNVAQGGALSFEEFMARCRAQSRATWRPEYTAKAVNAYLREGFRVVTP